MSGSRRDHPNEFMESLKEADAIVSDIDHHVLYFLNPGATYFAFCTRPEIFRGASKRE